MVFPWQTEQWRQLWQAQQDNRLPHALLFTGIAGTGKAHFAECFARMMLCPHYHSLTTVQEKCTCHACRLITGRTHPNVMWVAPEKEGQAIKIDQIRDVREFVNQTSLQGDYRIVIINPANHMNANAGNALLKTLEEPSSGSIMILISDQTSPLPATILSRCQHIAFPRPHTQQALDWLNRQLIQLSDDNRDAELILNLVNGAPLAAIEFVKNDIFSLRHELFETLYSLTKHESDPIKSAATLQDIDSIRLLDFMLAWMIDLLRLQLGSNMNGITNKDFTRQLSELFRLTHVNNNITFMEYLLQLRGQICSGINFNKTLLVENILVRWMALTPANCKEIKYNVSR